MATFKIHQRYPEISEGVAARALALAERFIENMPYKEAKLLEGKELAVENDGTVRIRNGWERNGAAVGAIEVVSVEVVKMVEGMNDSSLGRVKTLCLPEEVDALRKASIQALRKNVASALSFAGTFPCVGWRKCEEDWDDEQEVLVNVLIVRGTIDPETGAPTWSEELPVRDESAIAAARKDAIIHGEQWMGEVGEGA